MEHGKRAVTKVLVGTAVVLALGGAAALAAQASGLLTATDSTTGMQAEVLEKLPAGVSAVEGGEPGALQKVDWPTNEHGQTYGSLLESNSPNDEPDLILALTSENQEGYVKKVDLDRESGGDVTNPEEALEWMAQLESRDPDIEVTIPVYTVDGRTYIGEFVIGN